MCRDRFWGGGGAWGGGRRGVCALGRLLAGVQEGRPEPRADEVLWCEVCLLAEQACPFLTGNPGEKEAGAAGCRIFEGAGGAPGGPVSLKSAVGIWSPGGRSGRGRGP